MVKSERPVWLIQGYNSSIGSIYCWQVSELSRVNEKYGWCVEKPYGCPERITLFNTSFQLRTLCLFNLRTRRLRSCVDLEIGLHWLDRYCVEEGCRLVHLRSKNEGLCEISVEMNIFENEPYWIASKVKNNIRTLKWEVCHLSKRNRILWTYLKKKFLICTE